MKDRRLVSGCWTLCAKTIEVNNRGGEGKDVTRDHGLYVQKLESRSVPKKQSLEDMINQQSAARNTSNTKQHKLIYHIRTSTTAGIWPANDHSNGVRDHSNNNARHPHTFLQIVFSGKKTLNNAIRGRKHATTGFFRGYCLLATTFAWCSSTGGSCTIQPSRPRGRSHSQRCWVAFPGAVIVITTTSSFSHACACNAYIHVWMCVYLPKFKKQMNYYYHPYRSTMGIFLQ